jgi:hypothetical protein
MSSQTFDKTLDSNAISLLMGMAQRDQYSFPQKSAVREIASNAVDALNERNVAISILSGKSTVEDHYLPRTEGIYSDSVFDKGYYDLQWLSNLDHVYIIYHNNGDLERDELTIRDFGVGLWGNRLRGYFNLGYSTKRNSRFALGKFGIGAKSALSTGVPFYTMTTRYNGKKTSFNVYMQTVEPITPRFNTVEGTENQSFQMQIGENRFMTVYYENTKETNGLDITLQVKKHHKNQYIDAVKSQLMYFKEVHFFEDTAGQRTEVSVKAKILYEDDTMVISENSFHNKPHLLIDRVNYGNIEFTELELEDKKGNVGIKVKADNISVNPSRERVIWDDKTKQTIQEAFNSVVVNAGQRLQSELDTTNFLAWLKSAYNISHRYSGTDPIIHAMASIADFSKIKLGFGPDRDLYSNSSLFDAISITSIRSIHKPKGNKRVYSLERSSLSGSSMFRAGDTPLVIRQMNTENSTRKNKYISRVLYPQGYLEFIMPCPLQPTHENLEDWKEAGLRYLPSGSFRELLDLEKYFVVKYFGVKFTSELDKFDEEKVKQQKGIARKRVAKLFNLIVDEMLKEEGLTNYEEVEIPDEFKANDKEEEEDEEAIDESVQARVNSENLAARRKAEGKILIHTLVKDVGATRNYEDNGSTYIIDSNYTNLKLEVVPSAIDEWEIPEIYYCTQEDQELLHTIAMMLPFSRTMSSEERFIPELPEVAKYRKHLKGIDSSENTWAVLWKLNNSPFIRSKEIMAFMVNKEQVHNFNDYKHVREFFMHVQNNTLSMSDVLVKWYTARVISRHLDRLEFFNGFAQFNTYLHTTYTQLLHYKNSYHTEFAQGKYGARQVDELEQYLSNVQKFQLFVRDNSNDPVAVATMAKQMLNPAEGVEIKDARCLDINMYDRLMLLLDMSESVATMLNEIPALTAAKHILPELEVEIRGYIQSKNADILLTYKQDQ